MTSSVIAAKYVLGMRDGRQALLRDHYVYVEGSTIEAVTPDAPAPGQVVHRYDEGLVVPGFVNLHAHCLRGGLFRGIPDDMPLQPWGPRVVYEIQLPLTAIAATQLTAQELRAVTALGMIDLIRGGTTTLLDMWHHGQEVFFDVARELGLRTVGAPFILSASDARLGPDGVPVWDFGNDGLAQLEKSVALFRKRDEGADGLAQVAIGPHATDTCLPELLRECRRAADDLGCILTTHFAQTPQEVALLRSRYGQSPSEYARSTGLLGRNVVLAHAGCTTDEDLGVLASTGTNVANPAFSFARDGKSFPLARFTRAGINAGIGTDSHGLDLIGELRNNGILSKQFADSASAGTAYELMRAATLNGAAALGRADLGRIEAGAKADLLVYDLYRPHLQPVWDPLKSLIWKGHAGDLALVMIHGDLIVKDAAFLKMDEREVMRVAAGAAEKIWKIGTERGILGERP